MSRKQFAERLEVIAYPERKRRRNVGIALGVGLHALVSALALHACATTVARNRLACYCINMLFFEQYDEDFRAEVACAPNLQTVR